MVWCCGTVPIPSYNKLQGTVDCDDIVLLTKAFAAVTVLLARLLHPCDGHTHFLFSSSSCWSGSSPTMNDDDVTLKSGLCFQIPWRCDIFVGSKTRGTMEYLYGIQP
eukprot:scaffold2026_cov176-Amphora_coffeaeformis.AAC.3